MVLIRLTSKRTWHIHMLVSNNHGTYITNFYTNLDHSIVVRNHGTYQ